MREIRTIKIKDIKPNKNQPRLDFYDESIKNLAQSIKESGLVQPIVVRESKDAYELIAGERRLRALKYLGEEKTEAIIDNQNDEKSANMALIENLQREDLSAIEEALAIKKIMQDGSYTQSEVAAMLGYKQSTVANKLRLLRLDDKIKEAIAQNVLSERQARALLKVEEEKRDEVFETIVERKYNVAKTEEYIKALEQKSSTKIKGFSANVKLGINTIKQAYDLCRKSGLDGDYHIRESEDDVKVIIRFRKQG